MPAVPRLPAPPPSEDGAESPPQSTAASSASTPSTVASEGGARKVPTVTKRRQGIKGGVKLVAAEVDTSKDASSSSSSSSQVIPISVTFGRSDTTPRYRREPGSVMLVEDAELQAARLGDDFTFEGQRLLAKVVEVLDGDTIRVVFRQGEQMVQYRARMAGYASPRLRPPPAERSDKEIKAAKAARKALAEKIGTGLVFIECGPFDICGRLLVTLYTRDSQNADENGENINIWMISKGHGTPHDEN